MSNLDGLQQNNKHFPANTLTPAPKKRKKIWIWLVAFLFLFSIGFGGFRVLSKTNQIFTSKGNILKRFGNLLISPDKPLIGEKQGLINVLLLGIGGSGHEGPNLTDTIIVASINTNTGDRKSVV